MGWLSKFRSGANPTRAETLDSSPIAELPPVLDFDPTTRHVQWTRGSGTIHDDLYINPDPRSSVAGVIVERIQSNNLNMLAISLIARDGASIGDAIKENGLYFGGAGGGLNDESITQLRALGIEASSRMDVLLHSGSIEERQGAITERLKLVMEKFATTPLLSRHPQVRESMINKMQETLHTLHAVGASNEAKRIRG